MPPDFADAIHEYARQFTPPHKASKAVGRIKRAVQSGLEMSFGDGLALERELQQLLFESDDAREGIAANVEKRQPAFTGRYMQPRRSRRHEEHEEQNEFFFVFFFVPSCTSWLHRLRSI